MISDRTLGRILRSGSLVALTGDLVRALLGVAALATLTWSLAYYAVIGRYMFVETHMNDFGKFYYSAKAFQDGGDMYGPSPATAIRVGPNETRQFANMNPPHFHLFILPLARLSPLYALVIWSLAGVLALAATLRLIARELRVEWTLAGSAWTVFAVIVCSATGAIVVTGQVTFLLLLPVTLAWVAARRNRWHRAAVWLGIVASIKPFLGIFWVYLLVRRHTRPAITMVLAAASCALVGLAVFGLNAYVGWVGALASVDWAWAPMNGAIAGMVARGLADSPYFTPVLRAPAAVAPIAAVIALPMAVFAVAALARDRSAQAVDRGFAGVLLTSLLVSPLGWVYYLWLVVGPAAGLWQTIGLRRSPWRTACIVLSVPGLVCPLLVTVAWGSHPWGSITLGSIYTWATLALWWAVMFDWQVRQQEPQRPID